jgi:glycosyltransferase involved in cell wall biosynthesis
MCANLVTKKLTIITLSYNCVDQVQSFMEGINRLDSSYFDLIIFDGGSQDGTYEKFSKYEKNIKYLNSEPDRGFYFALNDAVKTVETEYYLVFGVDDIPSIELEKVIREELHFGADLILGRTRLSPSGRLKVPGPRWLHRLIWGRCISHHSVGTIIRTGSHAKFGWYDTAYSMLADGKFIKSIFKLNGNIRYSNAEFGTFAENGMSSRAIFISIVESFRLQTQLGENFIIQLLFLIFRMIKNRKNL